MVHPLNAGHTAFNKDTPWEGVGKIPETAKWKGRDVMLCETQRPYRATMARHLLSRGSAWAREGAQGWWESTDLPAETTGCHDPLPRARHLQGSWKPSRVSDPLLTALLKPTQPDPGPSLQTRRSSSSSRSERPEWTLTVNGTMWPFPCAVFRTVDERPSATQAPEVARVLPPTSALRVGQGVPWADHQREPAARRVEWRCERRVPEPHGPPSGACLGAGVLGLRRWESGQRAFLQLSQCQRQVLKYPTPWF
ncbi:hypothetical protein CapIbe_022204 [Capra ibex]